MGVTHIHKGQQVAGDGDEERVPIGRAAHVVKSDRGPFAGDEEDASQQQHMGIGDEIRIIGIHQIGRKIGSSECDENACNDRHASGDDPYPEKLIKEVD